MGQRAGSGRQVASGQIGSGSIGGTSWRMKVTLGPEGVCFGSDTPSVCAPVGAPSKGASLAPIPFPIPPGAVIWI